MSVFVLIFVTLIVTGGLSRWLRGIFSTKQVPNKTTFSYEWDIAAIQVASFKYLWLVCLLEPYLILGAIQLYYLTGENPSFEHYSVNRESFGHELSVEKHEPSEAVQKPLATIDHANKTLDNHTVTKKPKVLVYFDPVVHPPTNPLMRAAFDNNMPVWRPPFSYWDEGWSAIHNPVADTDSRPTVRFSENVQCKIYHEHQPIEGGDYKIRNFNIKYVAWQQSWRENRIQTRNIAWRKFIQESVDFKRQFAAENSLPYDQVSAAWRAVLKDVRSKK